MGWLRKRLRERSTLNGLSLIATALGMYIGPESAQVVIAALASLYGVYESFRDERN